ncbi:hypothetical protein CVU75_02795 [Candidatus Dependentiae bacterium HGW-Dependentiae-1]|nr:MAG: hypothetical protein CVU75_02795 [Candidatus Dependentiae bacterium HGW-Dependentiae-1]
MPYFAWQGVDVYGRNRKGMAFARTEQELDTRLFTQKIALLHARQARPRVFTFSAVSLTDKIDFFQQLAELMQAGILLPEALTIVADQQQHGYFQETLYAVALAVREGHQLHHVLKSHPRQFDALMIELVQVGQESGSLALALQALADYLQTQNAFYGRLRAALLMPAITFGFFMCVLGVVVFGILPHFAALFSSLGAQTPATTRVLLSLSSWASGWRIGALLIGVVLSGLVVRQYTRTASGRAFCDAFWLRVPFIGNSISQRASANFLQAVALLLDGGVSLVPALTIAKGVVANQALARQLEAVVAEVSAGGSLSEALVLVTEPLFGPEVISLATVGQETGRLSFFLARAARIVQAQVYRSVTFFATVVQPLVLIVLGLLIALLLVSVYMPVLNLANSI